MAEAIFETADGDERQAAWAERNTNTSVAKLRSFKLIGLVVFDILASLFGSFPSVPHLPTSISLISLLTCLDDFLDFDDLRLVTMLTTTMMSLSVSLFLVTIYTSGKVG